jgi:pSer/pThr/pTyr-binding forkhead associated (FHA) protein
MLSEEELAVEEEPQAEEAPGTEPEEPEADSETAAPSGPRLVIKRAGAETEDVFPFTAPATIGRFDPSVGPIDVDLGSVPEGAYVSRKHAKITEEDGVFTLSDLGSSNGTYVLRDDFERIESAVIADGDEIALGNARLVFRIS